MSTTAGLVLAAGAGRRAGGPKAPVRIDGERLVDRAVRVLRDGGCAPVVVVLGAWRGEVPGAVVVVNDAWETGLGSSLRAGLDAVSRLPGIARVAVIPVDLPGLTGAAVRRVTVAPAPLAAACYDGRRGHPVVLGREHWADVAALAVGDRGARDYLDLHGATLVEVSDVAAGTDLDTVPRP